MLATALIALASGAPSGAAEGPPKEEDYYRLDTFAIPEGVVLEAGALEMMPDGRLAVSTRRGEIYLVDKPFSRDPARESTFHRFAQGLHEVLGLAYKPDVDDVRESPSFELIEKLIALVETLEGFHVPFLDLADLDNRVEVPGALLLTGNSQRAIGFRNATIRWKAYDRAGHLLAETQEPTAASGERTFKRKGVGVYELIEFDGFL